MSIIRVGTESRNASAGWPSERWLSGAKTAGVVILGSVAIGLFVVGTNGYLIAAAVAGVLLIGLVAWQFEAALAVYALVAFLAWGRTPDLAVGGSGEGRGLYISELMLGFLLVVWTARYLFGALPANRIKSGFHVPIALYLAYCALNVVSSFIYWDYHVDRIHQYPQVNFIELGLRALSAGAFVMMATTISSRKWLYWITVAILAPGLLQLANMASGDAMRLPTAWGPLVTFLPACYAWAYATDPNSDWRKRLAWASVVALAVFCVLIRNVEWVSGWVGLGAGLAAVTWIRSRRMFALFLLLVVAMSLVTWPAVQLKVVRGSEEAGDFDRFSLLAGGWKYATIFPLGIGLGNYRSYNTYHYGELWGTTSYTSAHGTYAQHLAETGIPGLLLLLAILGSGFAWMLRSYRSMTDRFSRTYLLAAMGQLAAIAGAAFMGDYIIPTYHNGGMFTFSATVYSWLVWGLAVAHVRVSGSENHGSVDISR